MALGLTCLRRGQFTLLQVRQDGFRQHPLDPLGARFLDASGAELPDGGGALIHLDRVDLDGLDPAVRAARILVACDVDNPLLGPLGAAGRGEGRV